METVPVTRADFTAVLPRFLSLYVMSFLSPRDLCSAAQVCWHWRILAEQVRRHRRDGLNAPFALSKCVLLCGPGLSVGEPVHQKGLVPSLHAGGEGVRRLEEPLRLLRLLPGLADPAGGRPAVRHPQPAERWADGGGGGEEEGEEDQAADQRQNPGGEE